jgi:hypothetical protein
MEMRTWACGVVAALTVTRALAQEPDKNSANYLMEHCRTWLNHDSGALADPYSQGICVGKIKGVLSVVGPPSNDFEIFLASKFNEGLGVGRDEAVGFMIRSLNSSQVYSRQANGVCFPDHGRTADDRLVQVVATYIDARPARLHERFEILAAEALHSAWPCNP